MKKFLLALSLGFILSTQAFAATFPQTSVLDTGTRANEGPPPSANWTNIGNGLKIVSNAIVGGTAGAGGNADYWSATAFGSNNEAFMTITGKAGTTNDSATLFARLDTASTNGYGLYYVENTGGTDTLLIKKITAGVPSTLSTINQEISAGDSIGIRVIGSVIYAFYKATGTNNWQMVGSIRDTSFTTGTRIAIGALFAATSPTMTNFGGGTYNPSHGFFGD